jgi:hypothetical protein
MRNILGGIVAVVLGSMLLTYASGIVPPAYPEPFQALGFLLFGSTMLGESLSGFLNTASVGSYIATWLVIGAVVALFSQRGWNTIRTLLWVALISGLLSLASKVLLEPAFWDLILTPTRNLQILGLFAMMVVVSLVALPIAYPLTIVKERAMRESEPPIPDQIETVCECGAVFRSNPLICSECGRTLRETTD